ncbi:hypothetical protein [Sphingomonas vulcanisoli]|uniref:hypothetical protein n=1 Tax=Sphingomonas vulcanisoli TaxID=1658060 RepID=UPI0014213DCB|nr:hypothetical protein [Sphingomonas vulcanisoli]
MFDQPCPHPPVRNRPSAALETQFWQIGKCHKQYDSNVTAFVAARYHLRLDRLQGQQGVAGMFRGVTGL